jgi:tetratricopeptide (TPR) repeat protein
MTIRSTLVSTALGILTAVLAAYLLTAPARQEPAARPGVNETVAEAAILFEAWPICSSMGSLDPDFAAGKKAMVAGDWNAAIKALTSAGLRDARNADIQNYLGYVYDRLRQFDRAMRYYEQALALNPRHRSAHEHLGEAYLMQGDLAKASEHLAALERICLIPCEEHDDLKRIIAEHSKLAKR